MLLIVIISILNEKIFRISNDIALLLFTFLIFITFRIVCTVSDSGWLNNVAQQFTGLDFGSYLLDGVLCFMLFAGAGKVRFNKFNDNIRTITLLSFITTAVSSFAFGAMFYLCSRLLGWNINFWVCILLGCIISPTDPIAATGIMNKLGLSKNVTTVIESESLFNDGIGVALFAFVKSIVSSSGGENFAILILREIGGAVLVASLILLALLPLLKFTKKAEFQIFISLLAVSASYALCEHFGFSGVISSVILGMAFSYRMNQLESYRAIIDPNNSYNVFWNKVDELLNSVLFVLIGISVLTVPVLSEIWLIMLMIIILPLISRCAGVTLSTVFVKKRRIPGGYSQKEFAVLMTWSALKGGLSLALVFSTKAFLPENIYAVLLLATYIIIVFSVVVQGLTTKYVYRAIEHHKSQRIRRESDDAARRRNSVAKINSFEE